MKVHRIIRTLTACLLCTALTSCGDAQGEAETSRVYVIVKNETGISVDDGAVQIGNTAADSTDSLPETFTATLTTDALPLTEPYSLDISGSFRSDSGAKIDLVVNWRLTAEEPDTAQLTLDVRLSSYSLQVSERAGLGEITVGSRKQAFSTPAITVKNNMLTYTAFYSGTFDVPMQNGTLTLPISVTWPFNGTYGGIPIGTLTARETLTVG